MIVLGAELSVKELQFLAAQELTKRVLEKLASLPTKPGCYIYCDEKENVIYVGKAKSVKCLESI